MRVRGNEVLSDHGPNSSSLSFSIAFFPQVFGRLVLLRGAPVCFRQNLHLVPCVRGLSGVGICLAGLIGCNRSNCLHIHTNIPILVFLYPVSCATRVSCVAGPHSRVLSGPYVRERLSLFLTYSSVQDHGGPASFSTHARSNATTRTPTPTRRRRALRRRWDERI